MVRKLFSNAIGGMYQTSSQDGEGALGTSLLSAFVLPNQGGLSGQGAGGGAALQL